jgi:hypothetical protein
MNIAYIPYPELSALDLVGAHNERGTRANRPS